MNIVYIVGIVMAFFFTVFGIVVGFDMSTLQFSFSIGNLSNFVDLSSILIVIGGGGRLLSQADQVPAKAL